MSNPRLGCVVFGAVAAITMGMTNAPRIIPAAVQPNDTLRANTNRADFTAWNSGVGSEVTAEH